MKSKYIDTPAIVQVIGGIFKETSLLDNENYFFNEEDFPEEFHKVIFGSIYNLHALGAKEVTIETIEDYLSKKPKSFSVYKAYNGKDYLTKIDETISIASFDYYYKRIKKMTLFRMYESIGMDLSWLYDINNIIDIKKKQAQEEWLDNTPIDKIADIIDKKITEIRMRYVDDSNADFLQAGDGGIELLERLRNVPEVGSPLFGPLINTVTRGARLKKFYLRSAATGVGKTRAMIADACNFACDEIYDKTKEAWVKNGTMEPTIYISTEQEIEEIQTMMFAFLSDVDEEHILNNTYEDGEWERVIYAAKLLKRSPLHIKQLPDFSLQDIENTIKYGIQEWNSKYILFDYIHTSMKILTEVTSKTGIKGLREDNVLFMISIRLKDICNKYGVFILTSTQLNSDYTTARQYDQNLLRGAKAIADKIDCGMIMLEVSQEDIASLESVLNTGSFDIPTIKMSIYKNRRGRYKNILLWCRSNRGTCKIEPMFATNYNYELIQINDLKIIVNDNKE